MMRALEIIFSNLAALTAVTVGIVLTALICGISKRSGRKALAIILCVILLLHLVVFLHVTLAYVNFPYEGKSVVEGVTLYNSMRYLEGEQPYHPPDELPFRSLVYPPVHEMALAGVVGLLGPSLYGARLFSLLCALGTALVAGLAVWRRTRNPLASIFGGMFFICCYGIGGLWLEQVRNDALLAFLVLLGLYAAEAPVGRARAPVVGGVVLLLALYTKQTAIFAPAAVFICLWLRSRRNAIKWAAGLATAALAGFIVMEVWSKGWFSFYILKVPASVGIDLRNFRWASAFFEGTWITIWGALLFALPGLAAFIRGMRYLAPEARRHEDVNHQKDNADDGAEQSVLWTVAFLLALPLCLLQSVKWGAALNAFVSLTPIMAVLAGLSLHGLLRRFREREWVCIGILAIATMQVGDIYYTPILPRPIDFASQERIAQLVRAAPGDVFVSVFSSQAYFNRKEYFGDNVPIGDLERAKLWRGGELIEKTERGEFALMILRPAVEPADLARAVRENYVPVERIDMRGGVGRWPYMDAYVPKARPWRPVKEP